MRTPSLRFAIACLICLLSLFASALPSLAQNPAVYPGVSQSLPSTYTTDGCGLKEWFIDGPSGFFAYGPTQSGGTDNTKAWQVTVIKSGASFTITPPANAALGAYTISYGTQQTGNAKQDTLDCYGPAADFNVVSPAPRPAAGTPAFSWQGSVGGVNTGNGNKTTTLPITGWTMRGGMGVSCALYHNSQVSISSTTYGNKWTPSYYTYISGGTSAPVLHWDNGQVEAFQLASTINGVSTYNSPYGILDTLKQANSTFTLTTTSQTVYTFGFTSGSAYLSSITDMDGNTLSINHNSDATIKSVVDATNRTLTYSYSGGHLSTVTETDPLARVWSFIYNTAGGNSTSNLWYVTLPTLNSQSYAAWFGYDGNSDITAMQSPQGHAINATSTFGYNSGGVLAWSKDPLGNQATFTYNPTTTVITDPNGHTTTHTYQYSRLISVTDSLGYVSKTAYDYNNIVTGTTDKRGYSSFFSSHFSNGTSSSTSTDPLGYSSTSTYDAKNKVTQSVDAVSNTTVNAYSTDGKEDLVSTSITGTGSAPFKATSKVANYTNGLPSLFTDPLGFSSSVGYDSNGYVNSTTDANGNGSSAVFNALGWKTSSTDANGHTTIYTPDNWGRTTDIQAPDGTHTKMTYDLDGDVLTVTDANSHTVTNVYDGDNRLVQTTNGRGDVVSYTYDGADPNSGASQRGLLSSKTDGNNHTTYYSYTVRNEPAATYYPDGTSESVTYDANGNAATRTKADGNVIRYTYDADNRLTDITYPHLHATHFDYDADGRKIDMTDATGETYWDYTYDGIHMTRQQAPLPGGGLSSVASTFDADGRRTQMTLAGYGTWNYGYDAGGRLLKLQSPADGTTTFTYDGVGGRGAKDAAGLTQYGLLSMKTSGNGNYELYDYDACDQMTSIGYWWADGTEQNALVYGYDPGGNVHTMNQGYYATTYGYDGADQLTSEASTGSYPPPSLGYTYDHNGNRLTQTSNGSQVQSFTYDSHDKLKTGTAGSESDGYDPNGNETSVSINGQTYHFVYDDEDRLTSLTLPNGVVNSFTYNGLGLRVIKTDSTGTYTYLCDGASPGSPVLYDGHTLYTPGLSENTGGTSRYYSNDLLGNLWTIDGSSKGQLDYQDTTGFGALVAQSGSGSVFGFGGGNGCQTDADTGLVLMGHRYYDTRIGRFITQDPIGDGANWYAYCDNNPVNHTDPLGLTCDPFNSTGMTQGDIYDYVTSHGGEVGEEYQTTDSKGNVTNTFTVAGFTYAGMSYVAPQGENINRDIQRAKQFYASKASKSYFMGLGLVHDTVKIGDYLAQNYGPGTAGDPKTQGTQYDAYGHAIYAAAASELRVTLQTIIDGEVGVHGAVHGDLGEQPNGEYQGWGFDQHNYHPGHGIYTDEDFSVSAAKFAAGYLWDKATGGP